MDNLYNQSELSDNSRYGKYITLREAREIALKTLYETEKRLNEERVKESRFLLSLFEEWEN